MRFETGVRLRWWALGALVLSTLAIALDATVLVTALPTLSSALGATTSQLQWMSDAYTLALAGLLLPAGVLGDRFGRRRLMLLGLLLFGVSSLAASLLSSANGLIAMRAVMGAGAALVLPLSISILPTMFTTEERPRAVALAAASTFLGLPLGPLVAGWLLTHAAWGTIFLINVPVVAVALLGVWFLVPESRDAGAPGLDWAGALLAVVGVTGLVYGIIEEPGSGWTEPRVLAGLIGGSLVLAAFVARELRTPSPLVDLRLFQNGRFAWPTAAFALIGAAMLGVLFVLAPYLQVVEGNDAQGTGLRLLPMIGAIMVAAIASDRLTARLGTRVVVATGLFVTAAGLLLLSRAGADAAYGAVAAALAVIGLGLGAAMPPAVDAILGALPPGQTGVGMALTRALQNVSASFGVAILGSILNTAYRAGVDGALGGLPAPVREAARGSVAGAAVVASHLPGPQAASLLRAAKEAYATGMAEVLVVSAGLTLAGGLLIALFLPRRAVQAEAPAVERVASG